LNKEKGMKTQKVWKVGRNKSYTEMTCVSAYADRDASVVYTIGIPAKAPEYLAEKGYDCTAFKTLHDALQFAKISEPIFEAGATGVRSKNLPPMLPRHRFCNGFVFPEALLYNHNWPNGTVMCKTITLKKRVR
jgi:hypothetical protein